MQVVNVRDTRERLSQLLDAVSAGEEIIIVRRGRPAARLVPVERTMTPFPDRSTLRDELPPMHASAASTVRAMREEERF